MQKKITNKLLPWHLYGEKSDNLYLFIHGKDGNALEGQALASIVHPHNWQVLSVDLPGHGTRVSEKENFYPWFVVPELQTIMTYIQQNYKHVRLRANSIGAWFSLLAFQKTPLEQALFVSPLLDMEALIKKMMIWASVTEEQLEREKTIATAFGESLSWDYLQYAKANQILTWKTPTALLYGEKENLTDSDTIQAFCIKFGSSLTVMEGGEHWFHTPAQLSFLDNWILSQSF